MPKDYSVQIIKPDKKTGQSTIIFDGDEKEWNIINPRIYDLTSTKKDRNWQWPYYRGRTLVHKYNVFGARQNVIRSESIVSYNMALLDFNPEIYRHSSRSNIYRYNNLRVDYTGIIDGLPSSIKGHSFISFGSEDNFNTGFKFFSEFWQWDFQTKVPKGIFEETRYNKVENVLARRISPGEQSNKNLNVSGDKHYIISYSMSNDENNYFNLNRHLFI